jgi:hypothetical protein
VQKEGIMELLKLNELTKKKILFVAFATEKQQTCYIINTEKLGGKANENNKKRWKSCRL